MKPTLSKCISLAILVAALPSALHAQTITATFTELIKRSASGHSPSADELKSLANSTAPQPSKQELADGLPLILLALDSTDTPVRSYALLTLDNLRTASDVAVPALNAPAPPAGPATYKSDVARALTPAIPRIAMHLTEDDQANRLTTAFILGGFAPDPPAAVYPPLLAFLKRDDAVKSIGLQVVQDIVSLGPIQPPVATALVTYLNRPDQTSGTRADIVDAVASAPNQSPKLNAALLGLLFSDDPSLRARVILSLPQLDLTPETFNDTRSRIQQLAQSDQENLQVTTAAKAISGCWIQPKMTAPCPKYDIPAPAAATPAPAPPQ